MDPHPVFRGNRKGSNTQLGGVQLFSVATKSGLTKSLRKMPKLKDILVVDDCTMDVKRLRATLHLMFGYEITLR